MVKVIHLATWKLGLQCRICGNACCLDSDVTLEINEAVVAAASWQGYNGHTAVQGHAGHGGQGHPLHGTGNTPSVLSLKVYLQFPNF